MDILRYGPGVTVVAPPSLRKRVVVDLRMAISRQEKTVAKPGRIR
jgi:predicted DNA-binding transcriptional regulator YafY